MSRGRIVAAAAAALSLPLLAACGGDEGVSTRDYFATMEAQVDAMNTREATIETGGKNALQVARDGRDLWAETLADVQTADAPKEIRAKHLAYAAAYEELVDVWGQILQRLGDNATNEEVEAAFTGAQFTEPFQRFQEACNALRDAAADEGITIYLQCGGGGGS